MDFWSQVWDTVTREFSDLKQIPHVTTVIIRLLVAAILGGVLGIEREQKGKAAGVRTHMLVAIGAALFVLIPQQAGATDDELMRVIQGVITGVGFLGAGSIIKGSTAEDVKGLTTAAGIWLTAAIGVAAGIGRESSAVLCTLLALIVLSLVPKWSSTLNGQSGHTAHSELQGKSLSDSHRKTGSAKASRDGSTESSE